MDATKITPENAKTFGPLAKILTTTARATLTLAVILGAGATVQFGSAELTRRAEAAPTPDPAAAIPVSVVPLRLENGYDIRRGFIGQVEPQRSVGVSFELPGQLTAILVDEGDTVQQGQTLATLDVSLLEAERAQLVASKSAAEAQLKFAVQTVARSEELKRRGFATQQALDGALAQRDELRGRISQIQASIAAVDIRLNKSRIQAPFDARVTSRFVDGGEALGAGQAVLNLVELGEPQVRVGVPLDLDAAMLSDARIELAGEVYPAQLVALRPDIDPVTRTRTAIFAVDTDENTAFGQTARLLLHVRVEATGLWVPVTSLKEGVRGQWTVLTVDPTEKVRAAPVEILHAESERVFVRGAFPAGTRLIGAGPQRVTVGQDVVATLGE